MLLHIESILTSFSSRGVVPPINAYNAPDLLRFPFVAWASCACRML